MEEKGYVKRKNSKEPSEPIAPEVKAEAIISSEIVLEEKVVEAVSVVAQEKIIEEAPIVEKPIQRKSIVKSKKKKGKVILVDPLYVLIQDENGKGIRMNGFFPNVKAGDLIDM